MTRPDSPDFGAAPGEQQAPIPEADALRILERITDGFFALDTQWRFTYVNVPAEQILRRTREELLGNSIWDEFPEAVNSTFYTEYHRAVSDQTKVTFDEYYSPLQTHFTVHAYPSLNGLSVYFEDVSDRKKEEMRQRQGARRTAFGNEIGTAVNQSGPLRDSLQKCAEAMVIHLDAAFARIWILNAEEGVLELQASAGMYTHLDGPHARVPVGKFKIGQIAAERKPHLTNGVIGDARVSDQEWARREGMVAFAGYPLSVSGQVVGVIAMFSRDVFSEDTLNALSLAADMLGQTIHRKRTEEALLKSQENFRQLADAMPPIVWTARPDGHIDYYNERWYEYTGFPRGEEGDPSWEPLLHPDDLPYCYDRWYGAVQSEQLYEIEYRFKDRQTGGYRWFLGRGVPMKDAAGQVVKWYGTCTDIDERKQTEQIRELLAELAKRTQPLIDPAAILWEVVSLIGPYLGVSRCNYGEIDLNESIVVVHRDYCDGVPSHAGTYPLASFGAETIADLQAGHQVSNEDTKTDPRTAPFYEAAYAPLQLRSFIATPGGKQI